MIRGETLNLVINFKLLLQLIVTPNCLSEKSETFKVA